MSEQIEKRVLPVRLREIEIGGEFPGWMFTARINPPLGVVERFQNVRTVEDLASLLPLIIHSWNFVDEVGEPLGDPTPETLRRLPIDLLTAIFSRYSEEVLSLTPKSANPSLPPPG